MADWKIFRGNSTPHSGIAELPPPPPWRTMRQGTNAPAHAGAGVEANSRIETSAQRRGRTYCATEQEVEMVNAALYLRRPLLVTGPPGSGKSSLAYAVAWELGLRSVLHWPINSRSTLGEGLYQYDALSLLRDMQRFQLSKEPKDVAKAQDIGNYLRLGPLGTALATSEPTSPRVLVIDEIDKSDIDLVNDLLDVFEEGSFTIPELLRMADEQPLVGIPTSDTDDQSSRVTIEFGRVRCRNFPLIILTNNGERELPPAFKRRCLRLQTEPPKEERLRKILKQHLETDALSQEAEKLIRQFVDDWNNGKVLATDQLMNAVFMITRGSTRMVSQDRDSLLRKLMRELNEE